MNNIEFNSQGFKDLLRSEEVKGYLEEMANKVVSQCGDGYESTIKLMPTRNIAIVRAATREAYKDNLDNNTLLKSIGRV